MSNNEDNSYHKINLNCDETIYRKFLKTIKSTHFLI